jgi:hypothetical protein
MGETPIEKRLREQQDRNSAFPATRKFLGDRGLTNVRELDEKGRADLLEYLQRIVESLYGSKM